MVPPGRGLIPLLIVSVLRLAADAGNPFAGVGTVRALALQDGRISNVNVVQPATWDSSPASPNSTTAMKERMLHRTLRAPRHEQLARRPHPWHPLCCPHAEPAASAGRQFARKP